MSALAGIAALRSLLLKTRSGLFVILLLSPLLVGLAATPVHAQLKLARVFSDNMVLQQDRTVKIWGTSGAGDSVTVRADWNQQATATAGDQGRWEVYLNTPKAGKKTYQLLIESGRDRVTLTNVVTGEVWFCAGQSNMNFQLSRSKGVAQDKPLANNPQIRLYDEPAMGWQVSTYDVAKGFSAVGFYFGLALQQKLDVPVGLRRAVWWRRTQPQNGSNWPATTAYFTPPPSSWTETRPSFGATLCPSLPKCDTLGLPL